MHIHDKSQFNLWDTNQLVPVKKDNGYFEISENCLLTLKEFRQFLLFGKAQKLDRKWSKDLNDFKKQVTFEEFTLPKIADLTFNLAQVPKKIRGTLTFSQSSGIKTSHAEYCSNYAYPLDAGKSYHIQSWQILAKKLWGICYLDSLQTTESTVSLHPKLDQKYLSLENIDPELLENFIFTNFYSNKQGWTYYYNIPSTKEELVDIENKILNQCTGLDVKVNQIGKVYLAYQSDGGMKTSFNAWNNPRLSKDKGIPYLQISTKNLEPYRLNPQMHSSYLNLTSPVLFLGECYIITFTVQGKNCLYDNVVFITTPEQLKYNLETHQPGLLPVFEESPYTDIIYICNSLWCERNRPKEWDDGYNLSDPLTRRMSLDTWIIGPLNTRHLSSTGNLLIGEKLEIQPAKSKAASLIAARGV